MKYYGQDTGKIRNQSDYDPTEERRQARRKKPAKPKCRRLRGKCPHCGLEGLK